MNLENILVYNKKQFFEPLCKVYTKAQRNLLFIDFTDLGKH